VAIFDDQAADAVVAHENVAAGAEDEDGHAVSASDVGQGQELLLARSHGVAIGPPADAEGGVTGHGLVQADGHRRAQGAQVGQELFVHCPCLSPSSTFGPTSSTLPAPMVKKTSPGRRIASTAAGASSRLT
jgi:hypothetical protein